MQRFLLVLVVREIDRLLPLSVTFRVFLLEGGEKGVFPVVFPDECKYEEQEEEEKGNREELFGEFTL